MNPVQYVDRGKSVPGVELEVVGPARLQSLQVIHGSARRTRDFGYNVYGAHETIIHDAISAIDEREAKLPAGERLSPELTELRERLHREMTPLEKITSDHRTWSSERRDIATGELYRIEVEMLRGTVGLDKGQLVIESGDEGPVRFKVRSFIEKQPLTRLDRILEPPPKGATRAARQTYGKVLKTFAELFYTEGLHAGSPYYRSFFTRDAVIPALLQPFTIDALGAISRQILRTIGPNGEVSHEQDTGEQAVLDRLPDLTRRIRNPSESIRREDIAKLAEPVEDYHMRDVPFMVFPLLRVFFAKTQELKAAGQEPAALREIQATFFDPKLTNNGTTGLKQLAKLTMAVSRDTAAFEKDPSPRNLLQAFEGRRNVNWRDSDVGLGGRPAALDINSYWVPMALDVLGQLPEALREPLLHELSERANDPSLDSQMRTYYGEARDLVRTPGALDRRLQVWRSAESLFQVKIEPTEAQRRLNRYVDDAVGRVAQISLREFGPRGFGREAEAGARAAVLEAIYAQKTWSGTTVRELLTDERKLRQEVGTVTFAGVARDAGKGEAGVAQILNTDPFFKAHPSREQFIDNVTKTFRPWPIGLAFPTGIATASPAYSNIKSDADDFAPGNYHGVVFWSMPMNVIRERLNAGKQQFAGDAAVQEVADRALADLDRMQERAGKANNGSELYATAVKLKLEWDRSGVVPVLKKQPTFVAVPFRDNAGTKGNPDQAFAAQVPEYQARTPLRRLLERLVPVAPAAQPQNAGR